MLASSVNYRMPLHLFLKLFLFSPFVLIIISTNYLIDPANLFGRNQSMEADIAHANSEGWNVAVPLIHADYNERLMHIALIELMGQEHDILVFGSSRVRQITSDVFGDNSFYNFASAAANLEDFWVYYGFYKQAEFKPKVVILGLEHWMLDRNPGYTHWQTHQTEFYDFVSGDFEKRNALDNQGEKLSLRLERWLQLLSPPYFQATLRRYLMYDEPNNTSGRFYLTHSEYAKSGEWLQRWDGSAGEALIPISEQDVLNRVKTEDDGVSPLREIAIERVELFSDFIELLKQDGVEIAFFLPPVHPYTYAKWMRTGMNADVAEKYYREYASARGIAVIGSYDPGRAGASPVHFIDWVHPRRKIVSELITDWWSKRSR